VSRADGLDRPSSAEELSRCQKPKPLSVFVQRAAEFGKGLQLLPVSGNHACTKLANALADAFIQRRTARRNLT
jgi:hypothetical protein